MAARQLGDPRLFCFDLFPSIDDWFQNSDGSYSFGVTIDGERYLGCEKQTVWEDVWQQSVSQTYSEYGDPLSGCVKTLDKFDVSDLVVVTRGTSDDVEQTCPPQEQCRLAYIDAEHSYEAVMRDARRLLPHLAVGSWMCFDDAFTSYLGVDQAIEEVVLDSGLFEDCVQVTRKLFAARRNDNPAPKQ
jgi:hypothetical protein